MTETDDGMRTVRRAALSVYFAVFLWSLVVNGIPVDRFAVLLWMLAAFMVASIGRSLRDFRTMVFDWSALVVLYMAYDYSRGTADQWGRGINYTRLRDIDRLLFGGVDPNEWMQHRFLHWDVRWYDVAGSIVYMSHFVLPVVPLAWLRLRDRTAWLQYVRRFGLTLFIAVCGFIIFPAAPPWMAAKHGELEGVRRITGRGWWELHLGIVSRTLDRGGAVLNAIAPMPSLHAGMSFLVALWFTRHRSARVRAAALLYPVTMSVVLVYFGEHYVIDCIMGFATVGAAWLLAGLWERRGALRRSNVRALDVS